MEETRENMKKVIKVKEIVVMRPSRNSETRCDKFTSWAASDGETRQGFVRDTGLDVWFHGEWVSQYDYPGLGVYPQTKVMRPRFGRAL